MVELNLRQKVRHRKCEGALSTIYCSRGLGDCAGSGDLETPGPMFFGAVMTDIGYDFPAGLVSNTEEYNKPGLCFVSDLFDFL